MSEVQDHAYVVTVAYDGDGQALIDMMRQGQRSIRCERITHYPAHGIVEAVVLYRAVRPDLPRVLRWAKNWPVGSPNEDYRVAAVHVWEDVARGCAVRVESVKFPLVTRSIAQAQTAEREEAHRRAWESLAQGPKDKAVPADV